MLVGAPAVGKSTVLFVFHVLAKKLQRNHVYYPLRAVFESRGELWTFCCHLMAAIDREQLPFLDDVGDLIGTQSWGAADQLVTARASDDLARLLGRLVDVFRGRGRNVWLLFDQYNAVLQMQSKKAKQSEIDQLQAARRCLWGFEGSWRLIVAVSSSFPEAMVLDKERSAMPTTGRRLELRPVQAEVDAFAKTMGVFEHKKAIQDVSYTMACVASFALFFKQYHQDREQAKDALKDAYLEYYMKRIESLCDRDKYHLNARRERLNFTQQLVTAVQFLRGSTAIDRTNAWFRAGLLHQPVSTKRVRGCSPVAEAALFRYFFTNEERTGSLASNMMIFNQTAWYGLELGVQSLFEKQYPAMVTIQVQRLVPRTEPAPVVHVTLSIRRRVFYEDLCEKIVTLTDGDYIVFPDGFPVVDLAVYSGGKFFLGQVSRSFYKLHPKKVWSLFVKYCDDGKSIIQQLSEWAGIVANSKSYYYDSVAYAKANEKLPDEFMYCYFTSTRLEDNQTGTDFEFVYMCDSVSLSALFQRLGVAIGVMAESKRKRQDSQYAVHAPKRAAPAHGDDDEQLPNTNGNPVLDLDDDVDARMDDVDVDF
eukprot:TRINITY_DN1149_c0_g1_i1.p1 TRINITY_DN1149_c0_g1~~TRINITY_DN1149_c0_g1_i1.p1  ORF type:complete len:591 (-),score=98.69 TRINITY_DN1149_c0_g1_i1:1150-2922(-)